MTERNTAEPFRDWIGRAEVSRCRAAPEPIERLADLLDHETPPWPNGEIPPLGHWLYFTPRARSAELDVDGHPRRGGFLPPVELPRRMWAGGRVTFHNPLLLGSDIERRSTILSIRHRSGSSGELVFVTVEHVLSSQGAAVLTEEQDIVYREAAGRSGSPAQPAPGSRRTDLERTIALGPAELFRFSALTFNSHRIHYDRNYATQVEGYAGLVVHGPFLATLLLDLLLRSAPGTRISRFEFRGVRALTDTAPFALCLAREGDKVALWSRDDAGFETMTAEAVIAS